MSRHYAIPETLGPIMGERGGVRRMDTRSTSKQSKAVTHDYRWQRSQDHFDCFTKLIGVELEDELNQVEERWKKWSKQKLLSAGIALFDL